MIQQSRYTMSVLTRYDNTFMGKKLQYILWVTSALVFFYKQAFLYKYNSYFFMTGQKQA